MSNDRFTVVTNQSWFSRIGGAIKGVVFGGLLAVAAFPLLFWNEGRAVKRHKTLKEGGGAVISVAADTVNAANEGRLVHLTGKAETGATLTDADFGVSVQALKLDRLVEMYQWDESSHSKTKEKVGGGTETATTYTYAKKWSERIISSSSFKQPNGHQNPESMLYASFHITADPVTLGAFTLSPSLVAKISAFEPFAVGNEARPPLAATAKLRRHGGGFYIGEEPSAPQVGDLRVSFRVTPPTEVSLIAKQTGGTFAPYATKAGGTIELLQTGAHTAQAMIQQAQDDNRLLSWILRLAGFLLMLIGLNLIFRPFSVFASVLPFLGRLVGAGTGLVAFLLATGLSLVTISAAWLVYRPLIGGLLLAGALLAAVALRRKLQAGKTASAE